MSKTTKHVREPIPDLEGKTKQQGALLLIDRAQRMACKLVRNLPDRKSRKELRGVIQAIAFVRLVLE